VRKCEERCRRGCEGVSGRGRRLPARQRIGRSAGRLRQIKSNRWEQRNASLQAFFLPSACCEAASRLPSLSFRRCLLLRSPPSWRFPCVLSPSLSSPSISFPSPLKRVHAAPFDGSMILLRHYRASQTPNCSAYSPYYLT